MGTFALALALTAGARSAWNGESMLRAAQAHGFLALDSVVQLQQTMTTLTDRSDLSKLETVNDFFNRRIAFADDREVWGVVDHWATPVEALGRGRGDCEDYAIAKYFTLTTLGVDVARLRLVYVRAQFGGPGGVSQPHMVLAYYASPDADPLVLDNLRSDLRPASQRTDLTPVFSFNGQGLWNGTGPVGAGDPVARLSRWRDVIRRARSEGFQ